MKIPGDRDLASLSLVLQPSFHRQISFLGSRGVGVKALLLAEACNPEWTSVPLVGFNMAQALAGRDDLDVALVTHIRNREALHRHSLSQQIEIQYIDNEWIAGPLYKFGKLLRGGWSLGWTTNMAVNWPAYIAFEKQVSKKFRDRLKSGEFDVIHRITPVSPTLPSALSTLTDVPMMIGPLNGGLPWPKEFPALHASEREWLSSIRNIYQRLPFYRSSYRQLAAVVSGSRHTATEVPNCFSGRQFYLPENGIDAARFEIADEWKPPVDRFGFVTVGRLVPYKGFDMIIEAMASSPILRDCQLTIIGGGPQQSALQQQICEAGLESRIKLMGWLSQVELSQHLRSSQAFVFPSLREFGGGVVLEAMASGLPSIIVDYGGPSELIDSSCGIKIPLCPRAKLVGQLTQSMELLAMDEDRCRQMSEAATEIVRDRFTWQRKADTLVKWYHQLAPTSCATPGVQRLDVSTGSKQSAKKTPELVTVSADA